jgi:hypothetical protein
MRQLNVQETWDSFLQLDFESNEDVQYFREEVTPYCLIAWPELNKDFKVLGRLGNGSQATVDHYMRRVND